MVDNLDALWSKTSNHLSNQLGADAFDRWFSAARLMHHNDGELTLGVPDDMHEFWIESNYRNDLEKAISSVSGAEYSVRLRVCDGLTDYTPAPSDEASLPSFDEMVPAGEESGAVSFDEPAQNDEEPAAEPFGLFEPASSNASTDTAVALEDKPTTLTSDEPFSPAASEETPLPTAPGSKGEEVLDARTRRKIEECGIKEDYTFDTYVVGTHNRFAHAAAIAVGKAPARNYNPFFLHGGTGLGKTHLMQSIGHKLIRGRKRTKVVYLTCEQFTNEFIDAIQRNSLTPFRERYRSVDVLLIDDIQFLIGKDRSQEEFFHTFNALFDSQKQIVISSDRPAAEIKNLEPRLVSRFEWGLTAELQAPDTETRIAILRRKAQQWGVHVEDDIIQFLAERIRNNVRRLEGGLMRLASYASLSGEPLVMDHCEHLLRDILQQESKTTITIDGIQRKVAEHFDIRLADMSSKRRPAHIAFPRQIAMYLSRQMTGASLTDIGDSFGGRDHGTVIYACKKVEDRSKKEEDLRRTLSLIEDKIRRG
ncbi:chromosomal replication initiator protein DnaA [Sulfuriroseicoccus oceanibius]|uniref:Chromosomal replication initiator protein DnaA n=1 Tax=Sulfuriroseicoccus oceanibius TaxID=2707525 RepID=A0A6B3LAL6_9BACT|nr:chromosomal replication initiator protein DnaA [Sulfuriroseicoccus oceanibius]QQL45009.1 chromosomal replication initiator protein DnaA [Sulfuriroseicoccus oceanibius]